MDFKDNSQAYKMDFTLKERIVLLGKGRLDPLSERLHIDFHSLLSEGRRISIQAKAFMKDGTFALLSSSFISLGGA